MVIHARSHTNQEFGNMKHTHTHTMLPKMYKSYHETENPGIRKSNNSSMEKPAINVDDNLPISEEPILIFRPKKGSKKDQ